MSPESAVSLSSLLCAFDECELQDLLSTFSCRDESIANFLKRQAIEFEKASKSRTYLFIDDQSDKEIAGFFVPSRVAASRIPFVPALHR